MSSPFALPEPDRVGREHSERLAALIDERVARGPLPFLDYMALALYTPGLGYYMAGAPKFGAEGDFVTAPELSPVFGQCLAAQCREVLAALVAPVAGATDEGGTHEAGTRGASAPGAGAPGGDVEPGVLELGAGSGRLAASVIAAFGERPPRYTILEPSAELRARQRTLLSTELPDAAFARVEWIDTLPARVDGVILANEVMDALPVERFVRWRGRTLQVCVERSDGGGAVGGADRARFNDATRPAPDALADAVATIETDLGHALPDGYTSELCPSLGPWVASLGDALGRGVVLLADYGYPRRELYLPERASGTLACYYRHRTHDDPYFWPGLQDITAHVDFTRVAEAGTGAGLALLGYATQAAFLLGCDLTGLAEHRRDALGTEAARIEDARAVRTLTLPGEMGERFQFIAFGKDYDRALRGFELQDLTHRL